MKLSYQFYQRDVLEVAPELLGKKIVILKNNQQFFYRITEVEAYRGEEDLACHASKGRTPRTEIMYHEGGYIYVYLIYGMYWMLNIVTGKTDEPQAVLIRGVEGTSGPGRLTKLLEIDTTFYGESLIKSNRIWLEDDNCTPEYYTTPRIGIEYAGRNWKEKPWRYILK
ncbi:MAG: DNA-3-methyladenine glycosylase [Bacteroidales bacterium]|nr:DNA-3-methyladenine glycosylase [Bacteroidales bacterium]MBN2817821.1 DNA-3-methyladenine glycosylase [Bacteroidales bacterium]